MDLSAIIFVVLALAWAVYLIPKALQHHDEMASDRLIEGHSDKVRILSRKAKAVVTEAAAAVAPTAPESAVEPAQPEPRVAAPVTRAMARKAAQRRRRVLGVLVGLLVVVWALTWLAYLPVWSPAVPGVLVVAWLVVARLSVRKQQRARRSRASAAVTEVSAPVVSETRQTRPGPAISEAEVFLDQLSGEDSAGHARAEIEAALAEEGSLWDPLPMTLPTYVNKARARRTVRTIELTGISSSGHDETDTALAREAAATAEATSESGADQRKVAGA